MLGDICTITKGTSPTMKTAPGQYPLIVTAARASSSSEYQFDGEAVCIPMVSSTGHGHASLKRIHYASGKFAVANIIAAVQAKDPSAISTKFLALYLQHYKDELVVTRMRGTANVSLSIAGLTTIPIQLPPLEEQQRTVDLIGAMDDAIEAADGVERTARVSASNYVEEAITVQDRTTAISVKDVTLISPKEKISEPGKVNFVSMPDMASHYGGVVGFTQRSPSQGGVRFRAGDTLVARITPCLQNRKIAMAPESLGSEVCMGSTEFIVIRADEAKILPRFVEAVMQSESFAAYAVPQMVGSTGRQRLDSRALGEFTFHLPSLDRQKSFLSTFSAFRSASATAADYASSLRALRSELLSVLLSGTHKIPESYVIDSVSQLEPAV